MLSPFLRPLAGRLTVSLLAALTLMACERPLVDPLSVQVRVVSPDLETALTSRTLVLELEALRGSPTTTLRIDGDTLTYDDVRGVYTDTLFLRDGLNTIPVEVLDADAQIATDTLYALVLDVRRAGTGPTEFPGTAWAGVAPLPDGRTLVTGGLGTNGLFPQRDIVQIDAGGAALHIGQLGTARAGHTATPLATGEVLVLGGSTVSLPDAQSDLLPTAELVSASGASQPVPITGVFQRAAHATRLLEVGGRSVLYVYGGVEASGAGVTPSGTVAILELIRSASGPTLQVLSPPGGAGSFPPAVDPVLADLLPPQGATAAVAALLGDGTAFRFTWRAPGAVYPLDLAAAPARSVTTARRRPAAVSLNESIVLVAGGRTPDGEVLSSMVAFVPSIGRVFALPSDVELAIPRWRATATILAARRILIGGGITPSGTVTTTSETFTY